MLAPAAFDVRRIAASSAWKVALLWSIKLEFRRRFGEAPITRPLLTMTAPTLNLHCDRRAFITAILITFVHPFRDSCYGRTCMICLYGDPTSSDSRALREE